MGQVGTRDYQWLVVDAEGFQDPEGPAQVHGVESVADLVRFFPLPRIVNPSKNDIVGNLRALVELVRIHEHLGETQDLD